MTVLAIGALAIAGAVASVSAPDHAHRVGAALVAVVASRVVVGIIRAGRRGTGVVASLRRHGDALRAAGDARMVRSSPDVPEHDGRPSTGEPPVPDDPPERTG